MNKNYPKEAVPLGTFVRSKTLDRLGVVTDAFFDEEVENKLIYTCFLFPNTAPGRYYKNLLNKDSEIHGILIEESEFDLIYYLMMGHVDIEEMNIFHITGDLI